YFKKFPNDIQCILAYWITVELITMMDANFLLIMSKKYFNAGDLRVAYLLGLTALAKESTEERYDITEFEKWDIIEWLIKVASKLGRIRLKSVLNEIQEIQDYKRLLNIAKQLHEDKY